MQHAAAQVTNGGARRRVSARSQQATTTAHARCWPSQLAKRVQHTACTAYAQQQQRQGHHAQLEQYPRPRQQLRGRKRPPSVVYMPNFLHPDDAETILKEYRHLRCVSNGIGCHLLSKTMAACAQVGAHCAPVPLEFPLSALVSGHADRAVVGHCMQLKAVGSAAYTMAPYVFCVVQNSQGSPGEQHSLRTCQQHVGVSPCCPEMLGLGRFAAAGVCCLWQQVVQHPAIAIAQKHTALQKDSRVGAAHMHAMVAHITCICGWPQMHAPLRTTDAPGHNICICVCIRVHVHARGRCVGAWVVRARLLAQRLGACNRQCICICMHGRMRPTCFCPLLFVHTPAPRPLPFAVSPRPLPFAVSPCMVSKDQAAPRDEHSGCRAAGLLSVPHQPLCCHPVKRRGGTGANAGGRLADNHD